MKTKGTKIKREGKTKIILADATKVIAKQSMTTKKERAKKQMVVLKKLEILVIID